MKKASWIVAGVVLLFALALCSESKAAAVAVGGGTTKYHSQAYQATVCTDSFQWCVDVGHQEGEQRGSRHTQHVNYTAVYRRAQFRISQYGFRPYSAIGVSYTDRTTITQSTRWNFSLGLGVLYVRPNYWIDLGIRHDSNAGITRPNSGRDRYLLQVGRHF